MPARSRNPVPRCARCRLHEARCVCAELPTLALRTRVVLVMHRSEVRKPTATGPLALACLPNSACLVHGERDSRVDLAPLFEEDRRVLCLFPGDTAVVLDEALAARDPRPVTLVVPDGTWGQARGAARRIPGLAAAQQVRLPPGPPTEWGLRQEPVDGGLATFEAIARALGTLEGADVHASMMAIFRRRTEENWAMRGLPPPGRRFPAAEGPALAPLPVVFNDAHLVAIVKPAGRLVHRGWGTDDVPLLQALRDQLGERLYPVHRLDRATSGVLVFAKSSSAAAGLCAQFAGRSVVKKYLALCRGRDRALTRVDHPLADTRDGPPREAVTELRWVGESGRYGLFEATPLTGRLHQVRRHLKHASHPLVGDVRYGKGEHNRHFREAHGFARLALHNFRLELDHPVTGERLVLRAPLDAAFAAVLERLGLAWADHPGPPAGYPGA